MVLAVLELVLETRMAGLKLRDPPARLRFLKQAKRIVKVDFSQSKQCLVRNK